jgi:hypothetical protein
MRGLFRSALALFTVGLAMIGCSRSNSSDNSGGSGLKPEDMPYQAAFRVPGMS